jgi:hypothetical protein
MRWSFHFRCYRAVLSHAEVGELSEGQSQEGSSQRPAGGVIAEAGLRLAGLDE